MKPSMLIALAVLSVATPALAQQSTPIYRSSVDAARALPCDSVRRNADGSWTMKGAVVIGGITMKDSVYEKDTDEAPILETRCGKQK